jgi:hypothetical protein
VRASAQLLMHTHYLIRFLICRELGRLLSSTSAIQATMAVTDKGLAQSNKSPHGPNATPVRNEIAHIREVNGDRLVRGRLECGDVMGILQGRN